MNDDQRLLANFAVAVKSNMLQDVNEFHGGIPVREIKPGAPVPRFSPPHAAGPVPPSIPHPASIPIPPGPDFNLPGEPPPPPVATPGTSMQPIEENDKNQLVFDFMDPEGRPDVITTMREIAMEIRLELMAIKNLLKEIRDNTKKKPRKKKTSPVEATNTIPTLEVTQNDGDSSTDQRQFGFPA